MPNATVAVRGGELPVEGLCSGEHYVGGPPCRPVPGQVDDLLTERHAAVSRGAGQLLPAVPGIGGRPDHRAAAGRAVQERAAPADYPASRLTSAQPSACPRITDCAEDGVAPNQVPTTIGRPVALACCRSLAEQERVNWSFSSSLRG